MPDVSSARAERLVNLVLCLLSTRQFLSAERIRTIVPGYADAPNDEAFFRMFERDKTELRELGVPLESGRRAFDTADGYRIARQDYELGEIDLESDEAAAVALAARLWESPELAGPAHGALVKLRAAGVEVDEDQGRAQPQGPRWRARVRPAAGRGAGRAGGHVRLPPRRPWRGGRAPHGRAVGRGVLAGPLVRRRTRPRPGRAALVPRVPHRRAGAGDRPVGRGDGARPTSTSSPWCGGGVEPPPVVGTARVWVAEGRAYGLRRLGRVVGPRAYAGRPGEELELELRSLETVARWLAGHGPDIAVLEPAVADPTGSGRAGKRRPRRRVGARGVGMSGPAMPGRMRRRMRGRILGRRRRRIPPAEAA